MTHIRPLRTAAVSVLALVTLLLGPGATSAAAAGSGPERIVSTVSRTDAPEGATRSPAPRTLQERRDLSPEKESTEQAERRLALSKKLHRSRADSDRKSDAGGNEPTRVPPNINYCMDEDGSYDQDGLVVDHFFYCQAGRYTVKRERCNWFWCTTIGQAWFRMTTIGRGEDGDRKLTFVTLMDEVRTVGNTSGFVIRNSMDCRAHGSAKCNADPLNGRTEPLSRWLNVPSAFYEFRSPLDGSTGQDLLSWYDFDQKLELVGANSVDMGGNGFRCDSAHYLSGNRGCMFDRVVSLFAELRLGDPAVNESARHILDAQYRPDLTVPRKANKRVPGAVTSGRPLSRVYHDTRLRDNNHAQAVRTCRAEFGNYPRRGQDCDEYPFQSTYEGAASGDDNYSARALDKDDNQTAGRKLGAWYTWERILDDDPFYVFIRN